MNIQDFVLQAQDIFVLPDAVTKLKNCMDADHADVDDVANIINYDPGLASQILKIANSALYRFPQEIETVSRALQVIGMKSAYDLAIAYGISHAFKDVSNEVINLDKFWQQSVCCGLIAKHIADAKGLVQSERFFVYGLLHNIGELVVASILPSFTKKCQEFSLTDSPATLQLKHLNFTFTELSSMLIQVWQLPESIYQPIGKINASYNDDQSIDASLLQLSYQLTIDNIYCDLFPPHHHLCKELCEKLQLSTEDLDNFIDITNMQCIGVMNILKPHR